MNVVSLMGRITKDPEIRHTQSGTAVCNFTLAVNRQKKEDPADFISCIAWGKTAEIIAKYIKKGHMMGITGRIQTGSYDGKNGKVYTTDVVIESFDFLESRKEDPQPQRQEGQDPWNNVRMTVERDDDLDLPFV